MLEIAIKHEQALQEEYRNCIGTEHYKYWNFGVHWSGEIRLDREFGWDSYEYVSVDKEGKILGYLKAICHQNARSVQGLSVMNFTKEINYTFSKDFFEFLQNIFLKFNLNKISFEVIVGNPAEKMYDRVVMKYGGRIVGYQKEHVRLHDDRLYDVKLYEIMKKDFIRS